MPPPPGFNSIASSQPVPPSFIHSSTYPKQKDEFRAKLFTLFDGDMDLFVQFDQFCEAFSQNNITSKDFIKITTQLFKDKLDEYLLELIVVIPNIEQQNELYSIWERDIHPSSVTATAQNNTNWTNKNSEGNHAHKCRISLIASSSGAYWSKQRQEEEMIKSDVPIFFSASFMLNNREIPTTELFSLFIVMPLIG